MAHMFPGGDATSQGQKDDGEGVSVVASDVELLEWTPYSAETLLQLSRQAEALQLALCRLHDEVQSKINGVTLTCSSMPDDGGEARGRAVEGGEAKGAPGGEGHLMRHLQVVAPYRHEALHSNRHHEVFVTPPVSGGGRMASGSRRAAGVQLHHEPPRIPSTEAPQALGLRAVIPQRRNSVSSSKSDKPLGDVVANQVAAEGLPHGWPASLQQRSGLEMQSDGHTTTIGLSGISKRSGTRHRAPTMHLGDDDRTLDQFRKGVSASIRSPESRFNKIRFALATLILLYDAAVIPYVWGFDKVMEGWVAHQIIVLAVFWSLDMCFNFLQGYESEGELVVDLRQCASLYLKSGFALDAFLVGVDVLIAILVHLPDRSSDKLQAVARTTRMLRLAGLLKLQKTTKFITDKMFGLEADASASLALVIISLLAFALLFSHCVSCVWYFLGLHGPTDTGARWIDIDVDVGDESIPFVELGDAYKYTTVLRWHIDLFTIGNPELEPQNSIEKAFQIWNSLIALLMSCTVVSILSAMLVDSHMSKRNNTAKLRALRQYLTENHVRTRTISSVLKQARERIRKSAWLTEKDVMALSLLSTSLRSTLHYEICLPFLQSRPLLRLWARLEPGSAQQLCMMATSFSVILPQEALFFGGDNALHVLNISSGTGEYTKHPESSWVDETTSDKVAPRSWLCEAALSTHWIHVGTFEAITPCQVFGVQADTWTDHLPAHHSFRRVACAYAIELCRRVQSACPPNAHWPDDLHVPFTNYSQLVASMEPQLQQIIGMDALQEAIEARKIPEKKKDLLESQVKSGQSVIFVDEKGQLKRVTSGVSLELRGPGGKFFLQIGKIKKDGTDDGGEDAADKAKVEVTPSCMVPGHMSKPGELPLASARRLLESKLAALASHIELLVPQQTSEERHSPEFGLLTEYIQQRFESEVPLEGQEALVPFLFGKPEASPSELLADCPNDELLSDKHPPLAYVLPGNQKGTCYCFAWLSHEELAALKTRPDVVEWWLYQVQSLIGSSLPAPRESSDRSPSPSGPTASVDFTLLQV